MRRFFRRQWFLSLLGVALTVGFLGPAWVQQVGNLPGMRSGLVALVLFLMGLGLAARSVLRSVRYPAAGLLGLAMNIVGVPALAALAARWVPSDLGGGLMVAAAVPCTLASASVWTRQGGGNDAVSMLVTIVTNLLCFVITPLTLLLLIGRTVPIRFSDQASQLATVVVIPLVAGQLLRQRAAVAQWADRHKLGLSTVAQCGILVMVAFGAAETAARMAAGNATTAAVWVVVVALLALAVHTLALLGGWWISGVIGLAREDRVAVAIAGSQKTLMIGLQIAIDCGVSMLPMIIYHVGQLVIDTLFIGRSRQSAGGPAPDHPPLAPRRSEGAASASGGAGGAGQVVRGGS